MALEQKLSLKLAQKLVMTPSLQQAIKLLQMTRLDLVGVLSQEMEENPVLEEAELSAEERGEEVEEERDAEGEDAFDDIDLEAYFEEYAESYEGKGLTASSFEEHQGPPIENTLSREDDLYDQLLWQLHMMDVPDHIREIAELIIGNLEPDGFLVATIEEIQAMGADGWNADEERLDPKPADADATLDSEAADVEAAALDAVDSEDATTEAIDTTAVAAALAEVGESLDGGHEPAGSAEPLDAASSAIEASAESISVGVLTDGEPVDDAGETEPAAPVIELPEGSYPREDVELALALVRSLDPPGVACYDLQESLMWQLERRSEPEESLTRRLVEDHWELFTKRKFEQIARALDVPLQELKPAVDAIGALETRPGRRYDTESIQYVEPDVHVVKVGGEYVVQLNDNGLPRLRVSRGYRRMLQQMRAGGEKSDAAAYIKDKMRSAMWLIKSLDQRQRTIYKVAESIVKQQQGFLEHGVEHLRPMVLRDVAEDIEMHESTVSRVVSNKYIHTPRGLLPMKFFFHSGIDREYGGDISSLSVKRKIEQLIQDEDAKKPLSDSALMRILKREGIQIARRTVAKYRDELGIPSSTDRKKIF